MITNVGRFHVKTICSSAASITILNGVTYLKDNSNLDFAIFIICLNADNN